MPRSPSLDAVVVGAGPNGLAAAVTLARAGLRVQVLEAHDRVGGGLSSAELTLPGFTHDVGSAIHPLAAASPAFRQWPLHAFGLRWLHSPAPLGQTLAGGRSVLLERDLGATAAGLGADGPAWTRLFAPLLQGWEGLLDDILRPLPRLPRHHRADVLPRPRRRTAPLQRLRVRLRARVRRPGRGLRRRLPLRRGRGLRDRREPPALPGLPAGHRRPS